VAEVVTVQGAGGVVFEMDVPEPGSSRDELFQYQLGKGDLTILGPVKAPAKKAAAPSE
jgi:hypothetical protein